MGKFRKTFQIQEVWIALSVGIIISAFLTYFVYEYNAFPVIWDNYGSFTSFSAAFIGFLITAFTILFAFPEEGKIRNLKKHKLYPHIFYLFIISIICQCILFVLSLIGLLFNIRIEIYGVLVLTVIVEAITLLILIIWILKRMLDLYFKSKDSC